MTKRPVIKILTATSVLTVLTMFASQVPAQSPYSNQTQEASLQTPLMQEYPPPAPRTEGSLFSDRYAEEMFTDNRAARLGDIVTINIVESSSASKDAQTDLSRDSKLTGGLTGLLGYESHLGLPTEFSPDTALSLKYKSKFKGTGKTSRKESMTAQISARVVQVLPNGNLVIRGSREIKVNNEKQFIVVQGIVRPQDISPENTVLSSYIADAKIDYVGKGDLSRQQRKGWGTRLLDVIWPF